MVQKVPATAKAPRRGRTSKTTQPLTIGGRAFKVSNLDKVLYPEAGFTKGQVLDYYARIAPLILPHLRGRPVTLKRYPDGVEAEAFFEKKCPAYRPAWVKTAAIDYESGNPPVNHCLLQDAASLIWVANLAALELHTSLAHAKDIHRPTAVAFDLDPGPPAGMLDCMELALELRALFDALELETHVKVSGGKGVHLYVPLNTPVTYEQTKPFARAVAELLASRHPERVVSQMAKALRKGKVFIDWSQNSLHKTTVCVYSLRARARPTVSCPITWAELEAAVKKKDPSRITFEAEAVLRRVDKHGDLFEPVLKVKQKLPAFSLDEGAGENGGAADTKGTKSRRTRRKAKRG